MAPARDESAESKALPARSRSDPAVPAVPAKPALSLILCSRNDEYMGNSRWRLQTTLNYAARVIAGLNREADVEIVVADWGSEVPLADVLELSAEAARLTSFVEIPPRLAQRLQADSSFPEVLALNAAARRAHGEYIGRIDQDTLVGQRFLSVFFAMHEENHPLSSVMRSALMFSSRREIPYRFAVRCPSLASVQRLVARFGRLLKVPSIAGRPFWTLWVGIWLAHRDRWQECGGYDERLIHYNWMETDMIARLARKYTIVDIGQLAGADFYHLEHYHPRVACVARTHPRKNQPVQLDAVEREFHPNSGNWGLHQHTLEIRRARADRERSRDAGLPFGSLVLLSAVEVTRDKLAIAWLGASARARRRAALLRETVRGRSPAEWPGAITRLWIEKRAARRRRRADE